MSFELAQVELYRVEMAAQGQELKSSRILLEETLHLYADLYDYSAVACMTLRPNGCIIDANLVCGDLLRTHRDRLIALPLTRWLHPESAPAFFRHLRRCQASGGRAITRLRLLPKLGSLEVLLVSSFRWESELVAGAPSTPEEPRLRSALIDLTGLETPEVDAGGGGQS